MCAIRSTHEMTSSNAVKMTSEAAESYIRSAVSHGEAPSTRGDGRAIWLGAYPGIMLRSATGVLTPAGSLYERLISERGGPRNRSEHTGVFPPGCRGKAYRKAYHGARPGRTNSNSGAR